MEILNKLDEMDPLIYGDLNPEHHERLEAKRQLAKLDIITRLNL